MEEAHARLASNDEGQNAQHSPALVLQAIGAQAAPAAGARRE